MLRLGITGSEGEEGIKNDFQIIYCDQLMRRGAI